MEVQIVYEFVLPLLFIIEIYFSLHPPEPLNCLLIRSWKKYFLTQNIGDTIQWKKLGHFYSHHQRSRVWKQKNLKVIKGREEKLIKRKNRMHDFNAQS